MARTARENLSRWPGVQVIAADFEAYEPPHKFDAVLAFSPFHWLDPSRRYERAASTLLDGGFLVIADARLVVPEGADVTPTDVLGLMQGHGRATVAQKVRDTGQFPVVA